MTDRWRRPPRVAPARRQGRDHRTSAQLDIAWDTGSLKAGESKTYDVVLTSIQAGKWCNTAAVDTAQGLKETAEACTLWKGLSAVLLEVVDHPDPLQLAAHPTSALALLRKRL